MGVLKIPGASLGGMIGRFLPLLPLAVIIWCISYYGVNVPVADDWNFTPLVTRAAQNKLQVKELFRQHNEHRIFVPKLMVACAATVSHWDLRMQMLLGVMLCAITLRNVIALARRTLSLPTGSGYVLGFCFSVLLFSLVQYENFLWGVQFLFFIPPLCLTGSWLLFLSDRGMGSKFAWSMILAAIATFSFPPGAFLWLLSFPLFLITFRPLAGKAILRWAAYWLIATGACLALYLYDYHEPPHSPRILQGFNPLPYAEYAMVFLGGNLFRGFWRQATTPAFILGGSLLLLYLLLLGYFFRGRRFTELQRKSVPWFAIGAFALGSAVLCALGRRPYFTAQQALESRYTTLSLTLVLSVVGLVILAYGQLRTTWPKQRMQVLRWLAGAGAVVIALGYVSNLPFVFEQMTNLRLYHLDGKAALQYSRVLRDPGLAEAIITSTLYPDITTVRRFTEALDARDLIRPRLASDPRMYDDSPCPDSERRPYGRFESVTMPDDHCVASGWAILPDRQERADGVVVAFRNTEGHWIALTMAAQRGDRPDIKTPFRIRSPKQIGWSVRFPKTVLPPDARELSAWAIDAIKGKSYKLEGSQTVP